MDTTAPTMSAVNGFTDALSRVVRFATLPRFTERVAEEAGTHLDRSAYVLLARLAGEHCRVGELAEQLCLDVSTVSRKVQALEERGLATREPHPADRRGSLVVITPKGGEVVEQHRRARRKIFAELLSDVPPNELEAVASVLDRLGARIEELSGTDSCATARRVTCGTDRGCLQPGSPMRGDPDGRTRTAAQDQAPPGGVASCR